MGLGGKEQRVKVDPRFDGVVGDAIPRARGCRRVKRMAVSERVERHRSM